MGDKKTLFRKQELRLVIVGDELDENGRPCLFHVARWLWMSQEVSSTVCGLATTPINEWDFYFWIVSKKDVMCPACMENLEVRENAFVDGEWGVKVLA